MGRVAGFAVSLSVSITGLLVTLAPHAMAAPLKLAVQAQSGSAAGCIIASASPDRARALAAMLVVGLLGIVARYRRRR